MDTDHHQVPVRAAAENCRVLQTAARARLWFTIGTNAPRGGTGFEAVGLQWETGYVHVPGEGLAEAAEWVHSRGGWEEWMPRDLFLQNTVFLCCVEKGACPIPCLESNGKASLKAVQQPWLTVVPARPKDMVCIFMCMHFLTQWWTPCSDHPWTCLGRAQATPHSTQFGLPLVDYVFNSVGYT